MEKRILLFGHCHGVHVGPFVKHVTYRRSYGFTVWETLNPGAELRGIEENRAQRTVHLAANQMKHSKYSKGASALWTLGKCVVNGRGPMIGRAIIGSPTKLNVRKLISYRLNRFASFADLLLRRPGFDLLHLQFMASEMAGMVAQIPANRKLLVSIWGSDLLRESGESSYSAQLRICRRANSITVRSFELREVLLAKFGRDLSQKVKIAKFGSGMLDVIQSQDRDLAKRAFTTRLGVSPGNIIVCLGHSGFRENQHIPMLRSLQTLPQSLKDSLSVVIPLPYGEKDGYSSELRNCASESGFNVYCMGGIRSATEIAQMRAAVDVMVHLPVSDALSGAMCETIYAGNVAITGEWLPYGELRSRGIHFREVADIQALPKTLQFVVQNLQDEKARVEATKERLREVLDWEKIIDPWIQIYDELLS